jgi:glycosyltransferase involved in cell wall biosynthesis
MKLFFDARYIRTDLHDGISRYSTELGRALHSLHDDITYIICDDGQRKFLPENAHCVMIHAPTSPKEPFTSLILNKHKPDVVFSPMQTIGSMGRKFKLAVTLHDMIYYRHRTPPKSFPEHVRIGWRLFHLTYWPQRLLLNGADVVATVSETSKRDIISARLTKRPVIVVPNAPQRLRELLASEPNLTEPPRNLIYMGSFMPYKNVETLIAAMPELPDFTLHLLSRISDERRAQLSTAAPNVTFHNGVSDQQYARLLADRALLVSASFDEGYGIPVAEAMALGVPAVISDIDIFHEVAGKGALYFNPADPKSFVSAIERAANIDTYGNLSRTGRAHIGQYDWQKSAATLIDFIEKL